MQSYISQLLNNPSGFVVKPVEVHSRKCLLITPEDMSVKWTEDNKYFRSMLVDAETHQVWSMGFRKFTNFGEAPAFESWGNDWSFEATRKMDGSLLCISKMGDNHIVRTRGVADATIHETGEEIHLFKKQYPYLFNNKWIDDARHTILCEHTTPQRIIVLREHDVPTLTLLAIIDNATGLYVDSNIVDECASEWNISRPGYFHYPSISECIADVAMWKDCEGVVVRRGQVLKKVKGEHYLALHKLKSAISSISKLIETYLTIDDRPDYDGFYKFIESTMDFELAEACKDNMLKITNANVVIMQEIAEATSFAQGLNGLSRKDQAGLICKKYPDWRKGLCFAVLDGKENYLDNSKLLDIFKSKIERL